MKRLPLKFLLLATAIGCGALNPHHAAAQGVPGCIAPPFLGAGMVGWWPLDELNGATTYADSSGSGNTANVESSGPVGNTGSPSSVPVGKVAGAGYFRTASTRGRAPNAASLNFGTGDFAADCWVNPLPPTAVATWQPIVDKLNGTAGYALGIANGRVELRVGDGTLQTLQSVNLVNYGAWNFIAVSVDRSKREVTFYVNGVSETPQVLSVPGSINNTSDLLIGGTYALSVPVLEGGLDEVELFNRTLPTATMSAIWGAGGAGKCKPSKPCVVSIDCRQVHDLTTDTCDPCVVVNFPTPSGSSTCPPPATVNVVCTPPSGHCFPKNQATAVTCTATDSQGNTASCSFKVTVSEPQGGCAKKWDCGMTVATCYSDSKANAITDKCSASGISDPNGYVVAIFNTTLPPPGPGNIWLPVQSAGFHNDFAPANQKWTSGNLGEVFGLALDDAKPSANIFVAATSVYSGSAFGPGGPGGVYRLDGATFTISQYISFNALNPPAVGSVSLGNICYDPVNKQLLVADLDHGLIRRVSVTGGPTGAELAGPFDHGLGAWATPVVPDAPSPAGGITPPGRRMFGVQVYNGRLYYSLYTVNPAAPCSNESQIWSVGLDPASAPPGAFITAGVNGPKLEYKVPTPSCYNPGEVWVTDIAFSQNGKMLIAERGICTTDPTNLQTDAHHSRVIELVWNGTAWVPSPLTLASPFPGIIPAGCGAGHNSAGGVDYTCDDAIVGMSDAIGAPSCPLPSSPSAYVYGIQYNPPGTKDRLNGYLIDLNNNTTSYDKSFLGDVEVYRCCPSSCCVKITNKPVECVSTNMTYKWDFCITNCWTNTIKYLSLLDLPSQVTPSKDIITLPLPLAPGQGTCLTLYLTNQSGLTNLCFTVGVHTTDFLGCCSVTNCLTLPPCCLWIANDVAIPQTGKPNCYTYNPGMIKNLSTVPIKYLFLVPQPDAPNNCFNFSPNVITFNPPLLPNQTATPGQMSPPTLKLTINPGCPMPLCFLASLHDASLVNCCSARKYITKVKKPVDTVLGASPIVALAGTDIPVPVVTDGSDVGAKSLTLYEGTNAVMTIVDPTDGQHDDYFTLSKATVGTYVYTWKLTDDLGAVWSTDSATIYVVGNELPVISPQPRIAPAALVDGNISFSMQTEPGVACHVEYTESLTSPTWILLRRIVGDGSVVTVTDALTNAPQRFYRLRN